MKKVAINRCYGGFSISAEALYQLVESGSDIVEKCTVKEYFGEDHDELTNLTLSRMEDFKDGYKVNDFYVMLMKDDMVYLHDRYSDEGKSREHPDLISIIEKLGGEANGPHAELAIVEIPDDVEYTIEEYDGIEWIAEVHRTWR